MMPSNRANDLRDALYSNRAEMYRFLERLVRAESPSRDPETQAIVLNSVGEALESLGFRVRLFSGRDSGGYLLGAPARRTRKRPYQVMIGHSDTVWPRDTVEIMPITIRAGRMTGPGVYDMKGGLTLMVFALRALAAVGAELPTTPVVFVNSDEEIGSPDSRTAVCRLSRGADRVLVLEPPYGTGGQLKTARKGVGNFTIRIRGKASHAGLAPEEGVSAILELAHVVQKLFSMNDPERGITVNVGTIDGGLRANVVAPESSASVDVRVATLEQARQIEDEIRALSVTASGARLEIEGSVGTPPLERTPRNRALWQLARQLGREMDLELEECLAGGGSDGNTASLFAPTLDGLGPVGDGAHAVHEFVDLESMVERGTLLALLLAAPPLAWGDSKAD